MDKQAIHTALNDELVGIPDAGKGSISLVGDGVHFTAQGHKAFAAGFLEVLK